MAAILDLVNKSRTYVAEMYFISFVDHENMFGKKRIFLAGLSHKFNLVYGHGGHFEKCIFCHSLNIF